MGKLPAAQRTAAPAAGTAFEFKIKFDRGAGQTLGMSIATSPGGSVLVESLRPDGLIEQWNQSQSQDQVRAGDEMVAVNGERGDGRQLLQQLKVAAGMTEMTMLRVPFAGVEDARSEASLPTAKLASKLASLAAASKPAAAPPPAPAATATQRTEADAQTSPAALPDTSAPAKAAAADAADAAEKGSAKNGTSQRGGNPRSGRASSFAARLLPKRRFAAEAAHQAAPAPECKPRRTLQPAPLHPAPTVAMASAPASKRMPSGAIVLDRPVRLAATQLSL